MKKFISFLCCSLFLVLIAGGCSCKNKSKASLGIGDMNANSYVDLSLSELNNKIIDKDSFVLYVYNPTCQGCIMFKPVIEKVIKDKNLIIYSIVNYNISDSHELSGLRGTPSLVVYKDGEILVTTDNAKDSNYFKNDKGFISFLEKYTNFPTMYYISLNQLKAKIENDESFIVYYSRNDCNDCSYLNKNYLKAYLKKNYKTNKFYIIETNAEGIRFNNGVYDSLQWQNFKNEFGLSKAGNSAYGYGVGYVPTIQYYEDGELNAAAVYLNDIFESVVNEDGSTTVTIVDSYYSDNPYLGKSMLYIDYKEKVSSFYNGKLDKFFNDYLKLVD